MSAHVARRLATLADDLRTMARQLAAMDMEGLIVGATPAAKIDLRGLTMALDEAADRAECDYEPVLPVALAGNVVPFLGRRR